MRIPSFGYGQIPELKYSIFSGTKVQPGYSGRIYAYALVTYFRSTEIQWTSILSNIFERERDKPLKWISSATVCRLKLDVKEDPLEHILYK